MGPLNFRGNIFFHWAAVTPFTKWLKGLFALSAQKRETLQIQLVYIFIYMNIIIYIHICAHMLSHFCHVRLCDLTDYSLPGSSVPWDSLGQSHGVDAMYPPPMGSSWYNQTCNHHSSCRGRPFTAEPQEVMYSYIYVCLFREGLDIEYVF